MIVMINEPFGVGKTETANALNKRIPNSVVFDAEEVGLMLRNITYPNGQRNSPTGKIVNFLNSMGG
jgi:hypothetical protein